MGAHLRAVPLGKLLVYPTQREINVLLPRQDVQLGQPVAGLSAGLSWGRGMQSQRAAPPGRVAAPYHGIGGDGNKGDIRVIISGLALVYLQ